MRLKRLPWTDLAVIIAIAIILSGLLLPNNVEQQLAANQDDPWLPVFKQLKD